MKTVRLTDCTLRLPAEGQNALGFREKVEIIKELDRLCIDAIELNILPERKADSLLLKTVAPLLQNAALCCRCETSLEAVSECCEAMREAKRPRIQLAFPTSTVQMVYLGNSKPAALLERIRTLTAHAAGLCEEVEFVALDATRSEEDFLCSAIDAALQAGAKIVSLCDSAGVLLPEELSALICRLYEKLPALKQVKLGLECSEKMHMASACVIAAAKSGAELFKTAIVSDELPKATDLADTLQIRGDSLELECPLNFAVLAQTSGKISAMLCTQQSNRALFAADERGYPSDSFRLRSGDDAATVAACVKQLGYELSEEDMAHVYESFCHVARKKELGPKELEAIVASTALQVAPTYRLRSYVANSSNVMSATAQIELEKDGELLQGISLGGGPIDAAFRAIESIIGHHYDLDDFQIQSVTEGREAMGEALVKLRSEGKLYSGRGISTDIIGASVRAYINALNKICYEEAAV